MYNQMSNELVERLSQKYSNLQNMSARTTAQPTNRPFNDKFRYANPGEQSIYSDEKGNKLIEILSKIESNTQTGSKL